MSQQIFDLAHERWTRRVTLIQLFVWLSVSACSAMAQVVPFDPRGDVGGEALDGPGNCGFVQTGWDDPTWIIATSDAILRATICVVPNDPNWNRWYDRIELPPCYSGYTRFWKFAEGLNMGTANPMQSMLGTGLTFDGFFVKAGYEVQFYHPALMSQALTVVGPRYVTEQFWQVYPNIAPLGFEPNTTFVPGGQDEFRNYSIRVGTIGIQSIDVQEPVNELQHNTKLFNTTANTLVLRRGSTFNVAVTANGASEDECFRVEFRATHNFDASATSIMIPNFSGTIPANQWGAKTTSLTTNAGGMSVINMEIQIPSTAPIGQFVFEAIEWPAGSSAGTQFPMPVVILFNPWSTLDDVYMPSATERKEYVTEPNGRMWKGNVKSKSEKAWRFAQHDKECFETTLALLNGLSSADRTSPTLISRHLAKMSTSSNPGGIVRGRWTGGYVGGTPPGDWDGSDEVMKEFSITHTEVKFGQCWVFGGVLTTMLRGVGIPSRPITNYLSAHDETMPADKKIDYYYSPTGVFLAAASESYWNYHVWCDAWMKRPDLTGADGWQAVDGTPQELSAGAYQLGPAAHVAVLANSGGNYDVGFVVSEVDADIRYYDDTGGGSYSLSKTNFTRVGRDITTKSIASATASDITAAYKTPETAPIPLVPQSDITIEIETDGFIDVPETITLVVHVSNSANQSRQVNLSFRSTSTVYNGDVLGTIATQSASTVVAGNSTNDVTFSLASANYLEWLSESDAIRHLVRAVESQHGGFDIAESDTLLLTGNVQLEPVHPIVHIGETTLCTSVFTNPLTSAIGNARMSVSVGRGLLVDGGSKSISQLGTIAGGQSAQVTTVITGLEVGRYVISGGFRCDELGTSDGDIGFGVTHDTDINADGLVNIDDLVAVITSWGTCPGCPADVNHNGVVDIDDLVAIITNWGWQL